MSRADLGGVTGDDRLADLAYLRKGEGLTLNRIARRPPLFNLTDTTRPDETMTAIVQALDTLDGDHVDALRNAYGITNSQALLKQRRASFAESAGVHPDTIRDREDKALGALLIYFFGQKPPLPDRPQPAFFIVELKTEYRYENRRWIDCIQTRSVIANIDDAGSFRYGTDEQTQIDQVTGCIQRAGGGNSEGIVHDLVFPTVLQRGDSHTFSFREYRRPEIPTPPEEFIQDRAGQIFYIPALRFEVSAHFDGEIPKTLWSYANLPMHLRPGKPNNNNRLHATDHGVANSVFNNVHSGFHSGIAWKW